MGPGGQEMMGPNRGGQTQPGAPPTKMNVRPKRAQVIAAKYLKRVSPGTQTGEVLRLLHAAHQEGRRDYGDAQRKRLLRGGLVPQLAWTLNRYGGRELISLYSPKCAFTESLGDDAYPAKPQPSTNDVVANG